ncbi:MAG: hypothetical protein V5783_10550 [Pontiella sp.]
MKRIIRSLVVLTGMLLLSGCVKLWQEHIEIKTYMIRVERKAEPLKTPLGKKLWIDDVYVQAPYNIRSLISRENDVEFTTSYYSELLMSPAENFQNGFYNWISDSGMFETISLSERKGMSHRFVATVTDFYGDRAAKQVVLRIKITLFSDKNSGNNVLMHNDYLQRIDIPTDDAEHFIRGYNEAFFSILHEFERDARQALQ